MILKQVIKKILVPLGFLDQKKTIRKDVEIIPIQKDLELVVYWKVLEIGKGPALILRAHKKEILKFDCFGKDDGHFHAAPNYGKRIFFDEQSAMAQIDRTTSELKKNAQSHLKNQKETEIYKMEIDQEKFIDAVEDARNKMIYFLEKIPQLKDLR